MSNPLMVAPRERVVEIYAGDVESKLADLEARVSVAEAEERGKPQRMTSKSEALRLATEYDALVESVKENAVKVTLQAVPHRAYRQLQELHPPRKGSKRDERYGVNEDTFFPALVRAAMRTPVVSDEQFDEWVDTVAPPAWTRVANTAFELTTGEVALPKSSAVSALQRMRASDSKPQPDSV